MRDINEKYLLQTYTDRANVFRHKIKNGQMEIEQIYENIPCAIVRNSHTYSPTPIGERDIFPKIKYRIQLHLPKDIILKLGDYLEITQINKVFCGYSSDTFSYSSHSVAVINIEEVKDDKS